MPYFGSHTSLRLTNSRSNDPRPGILQLKAEMENFEKSGTVYFGAGKRGSFKRSASGFRRRVIQSRVSARHFYGVTAVTAFFDLSGG